MNKNDIKVLKRAIIDYFRIPKKYKISKEMSDLYLSAAKWILSYWNFFKKHKLPLPKLRRKNHDKLS